MRCAISRRRNCFPSACGCGPAMIEPSAAALAYSALAASIVEACLVHVERVFAGEHGRVPGGRSIVLALGKLGSREMTAASDLDLMLIYDFDPARPESDGSRPLHAVQYYTRLAQRLISALTVATRRGRLYEVDMRLRPSGGKGPLATQFSSFVDYQTKEAETWEHMALTRARPIAGNVQLGAQTSDAIRALLMRRRGDALRQDVYEMRRLIAQAKGDGDPWDLKLAAGGLIDIEFLAQYLLLRHADAEPSLVCVSALAVIETAASVRIARRGARAHSGERVPPLFGCDANPAPDLGPGHRSARGERSGQAAPCESGRAAGHRRARKLPWRHARRGAPCFR